MAAAERMITNPTWTSMAKSIHSRKAIVKLETLYLLEGSYPIPKEIFKNLKAARLFNSNWDRFKLTIQVVPLHIHFRFLKLFFMNVLVHSTHVWCADTQQGWIMTLHFLRDLTRYQFLVLHIFLDHGFRNLSLIFIHNQVTFFVDFLLILFHRTTIFWTCL